MKKVIHLFYGMFDVVRVRWGPIAERYNVDLKARIVSRSEDIVAKIVDVSESGCFASVDHPIEVGSLVGIDFKYQNMKVHAVGLVVRNTKTPAGCGFMFVAATRFEKQAIKTLIKRLEQDSVRNSTKQAA